MKLSAPTQVVWIIAVVVGVIGVISALGSITVLGANSFWLVVISWAIFLQNTQMKGMYLTGAKARLQNPYLKK
jgi:hypothetical protein